MNDASTPQRKMIFATTSTVRRRPIAVVGRRQEAGVDREEQKTDDRSGDVAESVDREVLEKRGQALEHGPTACAARTGSGSTSRERERGPSARDARAPDAPDAVERARSAPARWGRCRAASAARSRHV